MKIFLLFLFFYSTCSGFQVDYSQFSTPEELIFYQKTRLEDCSLRNKELGEAYIDLGESYLFGEEYELALEHLVIGYTIVRDYETRSASLPRVLFDLAITYANLDRLEDSYFMIAEIRSELENCDCKDCQYNRDENHLVLAKSEEPPILGPDTISIKQCIEIAQNTADKANDLISFVKRPEVQFLLRNVIKELEFKSIRCCQDGGIWKTCLRPILNKWYQWNEKWKFFKIPPDPAWD